MSKPRLIGNRFELDKVIGQGGMGEVWRGHDTLTGETVAIKVLMQVIIEQDAAIVERFSREGEALRKLNHPNIVKMLAAVEEEGQHYLVMEYVTGGDLYHLMKQQPQMPIVRVLEIALDLADALTRAHRLKIIHRDIKPPNVLLAEDGTPRLTDFGVARVDDRTRMTETGLLVGTYAYMSPEALDDGKIDERADIWSFGVMLYEMLAGRRPFEGQTITVVLRAIITDPVPDITEFRPDIPAALVDLLDRMLEKKPDKRIGSIRQVGAELEAILRQVRSGQYSNEESVSRFPTPTPSAISDAASDTITPLVDVHHQATEKIPAPATITISKRRAFPALVFSAVILILLTLGIAYLLRGSDDTESPADEVLTVNPVAPGEYMVLVADLEPIDVPERDVSRFIVDDLTTTLESGIPFSAVRIRRYPQLITSQESAQAAAQTNSATIVVWGNYTPDFVEVNIQMGVTDAFPLIQFDRASLEKNVNVRLRMTNERQQSIASGVLYALSILQNAAGDGYEVSRSFVLQDSLNVTSAEPVGSGLAANSERFYEAFFLDAAKALDYINAAVEIDRGNPISYNSRSITYIRLEQLDTAERDAQTALRLGPTGWAAPLYVLGNIALLRNDTDQAIEYYSQIIESRPDDWFPWNYRGALYYLKGDYEKAKADYEKALSLNPTADFPYAFSMMLALREGRIEDAVTYLNIVLTQFPDTSLSERMVRALGMDKIIFGPLFPAFGNVLLGQYQDALQDIDQAIAIEPELADLYLLQGMAYCNLDDYTNAEESYAQAIDLDPNFAILYLLRADTRLKNNDFAGSLEDLDKAKSFDLGEQYARLIDAGVNGKVTCKDFFEYQP